jgi:hypothetical protein
VTPSVFGIAHSSVGMIGKKPVCANCGIEIGWQATVVDGRLYCCLGCAMGGPCTCDYSNLPRLGESRALVYCRSRTTALLLAKDGRAASENEPESASLRPAAE